MAFGREVAEAYIEVHGDLTPFRRDLARAQVLTSNFGKKIKGLAGLNVLEDTFRFGIRFMQNIDRNAMRIANMATLVLTATAGITQFIGATAAISTDLAALGQIGILAPAFLTGFGIAIGVAAAAFKDMDVVLKDLKPAFADLQNRISAKFWEQAAQPIRNLTNSLLPTLRTQLSNTATVMGSMFAELANSFKNEATPERVTIMFERMNRALTIAKAGIGPFVRAMVNLGEVGSKQFERFGHWVVELSEKFDNFVTRSINNGDMDRWIEEAIEGFKNVGRSIDGAIGIVNALDSAFRAAGGGGLSVFAEKLQGAAEIMQGEVFQTALTQAFTGARAAMDGLFRGIGLLGEAFVDLGPTFIAVGEQVGQILTVMGAHLRDFLMNDELQQGFITFMSDAQAAIRELGPAIQPLATSMGGLLTLMGEVLKSVAEVATTLLVQWGPVLDSMSAKLSELVTPLKIALESVITTLTPALQSFSDEVLVPVVDIIKNQILPAIADIAKAVGPSLTVAFEELGQFLREDLTPVFEHLAGKYKDAGENGDEFAINLREVIQAIEDFLNIASSPRETFAWLNSEPVKQFNDSVNQELENFWASVGENIRVGNEGLSRGITDGWNGLIASVGNSITLFNESVNQGLADFWAGIGTSITTGWETIATNFSTQYEMLKTNLMMFFEQFAAGWNGFWGGLGEGLSMMWEGVLAALAAGYQAILNGVDFLLVQPFKAFWTSLWDNLDPQTREAFTRVVTAVQESVTNIINAITTFGNNVKLGWDIIWNTVSLKVTEIWNTIKTTIDTKVGEIRNGITTFGTTVKAVWDAFWATMKAKVDEIWNTIRSVVDSKTGEIRNGLNSFGSQVQSLWNNLWSTVGNALSEAWNRIVSVVTERFNSVRNQISSVGSNISSAWNQLWSSVGQILSSAWNSLVSTVQQKGSEIVSWFRGLPNQIASALGSLSGQMLTAGKNAIQGFINGMWSMISGVVNTAANLAGQAMAAVRKALNLGSPSKIMRQYGEWTGEGFAIGMDNMGGLVMRTAGAMAAKALDVFSDKSMYQTGADAAIALAAGMKDNASQLDKLVEDMAPAVTARFEQIGSIAPTATLSGGAGGNTSRTVVFEQGSFQLVTPVRDPEIVVHQVMDEFANSSNF